MRETFAINERDELGQIFGLEGELGVIRQLDFEEHMKKLVDRLNTHQIILSRMHERVWYGYDKHCLRQGGKGNGKNHTV